MKYFPCWRPWTNPQTMVNLPCYPMEVTMVWGTVRGIQHGIIWAKYHTKLYDKFNQFPDQFYQSWSIIILWTSVCHGPQHHGDLPRCPKCVGARTKSHWGAPTTSTTSRQTSKEVVRSLGSSLVSRLRIQRNIWCKVISFWYHSLSQLVSLASFTR